MKICQFMVLSLRILLRKRNDADESCRKQNIHFNFNNIFRKTCYLFCKITKAMLRFHCQRWSRERATILRYTDTVQVFLNPFLVFTTFIIA